MDKKVLVIEDEGMAIATFLVEAHRAAHNAEKQEAFFEKYSPGNLLAEHDLSTVGGINNMAATLLSANEKNQSVTVLILGGKT